MKMTSVIMVVASIGFILMGLFIIKSKSISKTMVTEDNKEESKDFIKKNGFLNILVGIIGVVLAMIDQIVNGWSGILVVIFVILIFTLSIIQYNLGKNYRNKLK